MQRIIIDTRPSSVGVGLTALLPHQARPGPADWPISPYTSVLDTTSHTQS